MVYRVTGTFRLRIDELMPYFRHGELIDESETEVLRALADEPGATNIEVRATAPGFYVHWWSVQAAADRQLGVVGFDEQEVRTMVFTHIGRWTDDLYQREWYVDFHPVTGDLTVGHYQLLPYAADPALSARLIQDGSERVVAERKRVESTLRERIQLAVADRAKKTSS